jgi:hypothetical protein
MAVAIIFGLALSTVLTLGVVPALYLGYARLRERTSRRMGWTPGGELDVLEGAEPSA